MLAQFTFYYCSELLPHLCALFVLHAHSEIYHLYLGTLFFGLKKQVLGLEIPVHDPSLVAVGDAGKNLLHQIRRLPLCELVDLLDPVEQLTARAVSDCQ